MKAPLGLDQQPVYELQITLSLTRLPLLLGLLLLNGNAVASFYARSADGLIEWAHERIGEGASLLVRRPATL